MSDDKNDKKTEDVSDSTKDFLRDKKKRSDESSDHKDKAEQGPETDGENFRD